MAESQARLTASDVEAKKFSATMFRRGYDQSEVDTFLDRVVVALGGAGSASALRVDDVERAAFTVVKYRPGYDREQVDSFLAQITAELRTGRS